MLNTTTARRSRNGAVRGAHGETTDRIAAAAHETVDRVAKQAGGVEHDLRQRTAALGEQAREQEKQARAAVAANMRKARAYVRKQPLLGAGIAFAVGIVLSGLLLRR
jgi:ElaB/YqjD/DUF883 family membrane-anchored ribosome-binding protein